MKNIFILAVASAIFCTLFSCKMPGGKRGDTYVYTLEISQADLLRNLSGHNRDSAFNAAITKAQKLRSSGNKTPFITLFAQSYADIAPSGHLSAIFGYTPHFQNNIKVSSTNEEIISVLTADINAASQKTASILAHRVDNMGQSYFSVSILKDSSKILLELGEPVTPIRMRTVLLNRGDIEFWDTYENEELYANLIEADKMVAKELRRYLGQKNNTSKRQEDFFANAIVAVDTSGGKTRTVAVKPLSSIDTSLFTYPLLRILNPMADNQNGIYPGPVIGMSLGKDTSMVNTYLLIDSVRPLFPRDVKFIWAAKPRVPEKNIYELYVIKTNLATTGPAICADAITDAHAGYDSNGNPDITLTMDQRGANLWERMTDAAANSTLNGKSLHRCVAIVMNNRVFSAPRVQNKIPGGNTQITGVGNVNEAMDLVNVIKEGPLPAPIRLLEVHAIHADHTKD